MDASDWPRTNTDERRWLRIGSVIAAAGQSRRMGRPKQLLPWGDRTVIEAVVKNLDAAGASPIVCVVGHRRTEVEAVLSGTPAAVVYNKAYASSEMLSSVQAGITWLAGDDAFSKLAGVLLSLGDQPHLGPKTIAQVIEQARATPGHIVIPSHAMRRGHPIYLPRRLWTRLLSLGEGDSLRVLLAEHAEAVVYVNVESDAVLRDMDTPAAYEQLRHGLQTGSALPDRMGSASDESDACDAKLA